MVVFQKTVPFLTGDVEVTIDLHPTRWVAFGYKEINGMMPSRPEMDAWANCWVRNNLAALVAQAAEMREAA